MRKGGYYDIKLRMLEFMATQTDDGICSRQQLVKKFKLPKSSATDILTCMKKDGFVVVKNRKELRKNSVNKIQTIAITGKGRNEYRSKFLQGEFRFSPYLKQYLATRKISEDQLFPIQQDFVDRGLVYSKSNVCVFGYPGAGKTLIAEMAMAQDLVDGGKVLYCTPYKALDWQKAEDFRTYFGCDYNVVIADSDNYTSYENLQKASIIVATYERVLGSLKQNEDWIKDVTLVCADEITLLEDRKRGGVIDLILTQLKRLETKPRIITLSSLVGNPFDISRWMNAETVIDNRPARMEINENLVFPKDGKMNTWNKDGKKTSLILKDDPMYELVRRNLENDNTTVIFTGFKTGTKKIVESLLPLHKKDPDMSNRIREFTKKNSIENTSQTKDVFDFMEYGIAYHHAGMQKSVRRFIEYLLNRNKIKTVVATTTLSHGVDYKIDSVIVDIWPLNVVKGKLPVYEYINLKGRAGRPGKSKNADVYILTHDDPDKIFETYFLSSPEPLTPSGTLDDKNMLSTILYRSDPELTADNLSELVKSTFQHMRKPKEHVRLKAILRFLLKHKFLKLSGKTIRITELGRAVNKSNINPLDAVSVLKIYSSSTSEDLLQIASNIDIVKELNLSGTILKAKVPILKDWMRGKPIDELREIYGFFYDQELIDLASYTHLSLGKIRVMMESPQVKRKISQLITRFNKRMNR